MFDLTSSKMLILAIIAILVVGPKDLPVLLRTLGKYMGMIRKQANEFRAQFDEAMKESELDQIRKDVENLSREAESTMREAESSVRKEVDAASAEMDKSIKAPVEAAKVEATAPTAEIPKIEPLTKIETATPLPRDLMEPPFPTHNGVNGSHHASADVTSAKPAAEVKTGA
jgi:sec-independent protein translocase protein TatB